MTGSHVRGGGDRGSASLWLLAVGLVLVVAGIAGAAVGTVQIAGRQAQLAADFGALAGAAHLAEGPEVACDRASQLVRANHGRLTGCRSDGLDLVVAAEVVATPLPGLVRAVHASARAGPVRG